MEQWEREKLMLQHFPRLCLLILVVRMGWSYDKSVGKWAVGSMQHSDLRYGAEF